MKKRTIELVSWIDPLAWTERMSGPRWNQLLLQEKVRYQSVLKKYTTPDTIQRISDELAVASEAQQSEPFLVRGKVQVWDLGTLSVKWKWTTTGNEHFAADCAIDDDGNVWDVIDTGNGAETYTIRYWPYGSIAPSWELGGVGPYVLVMGGICFFLEARNSLWYSRFSCISAKTGKGLKVLYEEKNPLWNLSLKRGENHTGYLVREDSGLQEAFFFHSSGTLRKLPESGFFVFGGGAPNDYLATQGRGTDSWKGYGPRLSRWNLPTEFGIPEFVWPEEKLLVTRRQGERYLWLCSTLEKPKLLYKVLGQILLNEWSMFAQEKLATARIIEPGAFPTLCKIQKDTLVCLPPLLGPYGIASRESVAGIPYILVKPLSGPVRSLLVTGYGAYGMPSNLDTTRWNPLLKRGWAIAIALVRGGGDDTLEWADAARTYRREIAVNDFITVVKAAQKQTGISAKHTAVYGRSAGGLLIGAAAARQKNRELFGALYGEVPYLDILRTTTNPKLPLTQMEFNEFGNPAGRLEDLVTVGKVSPIEGIPDQGYPGLFALLRTGENDKEVFAYEPVKWILKARGPRKTDASKLLAFEENQGHFVGGTDGRQNRAADLALLIAWRSSGQIH